MLNSRREEVSQIQSGKLLQGLGKLLSGTQELSQFEANLPRRSLSVCLSVYLSVSPSLCLSSCLCWYVHGFVVMRDERRQSSIMREDK